VSTSSMRTSHWPPWALASSQLASAATKEPACRGPVGEGANLPVYVAPTLPTACGSLPPEGAVACSGRPFAARSLAVCGVLPPEGAVACSGRPFAARSLAACGVLPPEGAVACSGRPFAARSLAACGVLPLEGVNFGSAAAKEAGGGPSDNCFAVWATTA
jgi:hypothetical protein